MKELVRRIRWYEAAEKIADAEWDKAWDKASRESTESYGTHAKDYTSAAYAKAQNKMGNHYYEIRMIANKLSEEEFNKILSENGICLDSWVWADIVDKEA